MTDLQAAIQRFVQAFGRDGRDFGHIEQTDNKLPLPADLPLTGQVRDFYTATVFDDLLIDGELMVKLQSSSELWDAQLGWRWRVEPSGKLVPNDALWDMSWLVIGHFNDDAIFVKTDDPQSPVFGTIRGDQNSFQLSQSLSSFLLILADCMIMEELEFEFDTKTDDFSVKPEFIKRVEQIVKGYEDEGITEGFIGFFFS